jgi:hypothetical protein
VTKGSVSLVLSENGDGMMTMVMAGVPLNVVGHNLGYADTRMTEKHCAHLAPSYVAETIRRLVPSFGTVERSTVDSIDRAR